MTEPIFVCYVPSVADFRYECRHSQALLALEPDEYPICADSIVTLRYDFEQGRHVGQCPDCGKHYYALAAESEPPR